MRGRLRPAPLLIWVAAALAATPAARATPADSLEAVAIASRASKDYVRERLPDGTARPETYAFGKGGLWKGEEAGTKEVVDFMQVARALAAPLKSRGYVPTSDPRGTKLLVMVYWGTTHTPDHATDSIAVQNLQAANSAVTEANNAAQSVRFNPNDSCAPPQLQSGSHLTDVVRTPEQMSMENAMSGALALAASEDNQRLRADAQNASMLGYDSLWNETAQFAGTPMEGQRQDLLAELESRRYFVVLMAYDFQEMWKQRKPRLLWETRFSIRESGNDLGERLDAMAAKAARYFGEDTAGLVREPLPEGRVEMGPLREIASDASGR
jgi:hypothetical protein